MSTPKQTPETEFNLALRATQDECRYIVPEDSVNPHFKSKFASLTSVLRHALPVAAKNGLTLSQRTDIRESDVVLVSTLRHDAGFSVESVWPVASIGTDQQKLGSALTYSKRYQASTLLGLAADEDDDGNAAVSQSSQTKPKQNVKQSVKRDVKKEAEEIRKEIADLAAEMGPGLYRALVPQEPSTLKEAKAALDLLREAQSEREIDQKAAEEVSS